MRGALFARFNAPGRATEIHVEIGVQTKRDKTGGACPWSVMNFCLRNVWRGTKHTPFLSAVMFLGITCGLTLASFGLILNFYSELELQMTLEEEEIEAIEDEACQEWSEIRHVRINNWDRPYSYFWLEEVEISAREPSHITWKDAVALNTSPIPTLKSPSFRSELVVQAGDKEPLKVEARVCSADFFALTRESPLQGRFWTREEEAAGAKVVVISEETNVSLFEGQGVGRKLTIHGEEFEVVGIQKEFNAFLRLDSHEPFAVQGAPEIFVPFAWTQKLRLTPYPRAFSWKPHEPGYDAFLASEDNWIDYWVEVEEDKVGEYEAFVQGYIREQRRSGRLARETTQPVRNLIQWSKQVRRHHHDKGLIWLMDILWLVLSGASFAVLLGVKFHTRVREVCIKRALGATRLRIFFEFVVEGTLSAIVLGVISVCAAYFGMRFLASYVDMMSPLTEVRWSTLFVVMAVVVGSLSFVSIFPAWKACQTPMASHLKRH